MTSDHFSATVDAIVAADPRFDRDAYLFVRDALVFTARQQRKRRGGSPAASAPECHVSGPQLLEGVRQYALDQFGPMVPSVFGHWRISSCADIGAIVFNLIEAGEFGKTEQDSIADFQGGFDFHEAFVQPFRPVKRLLPAAPAGAGQRPRKAVRKAA